MSHEDIRRSLEVLDNVLAEFDDPWNTPYSHLNGNDSSSIVAAESQRLSEEEETEMTHANGHSSSQDSFSSQNHSRDGSTSQFFSFDVQEQIKVSSPPPIPKRSPATKLSDRNSTLFTFSSDNTSLDSYDSIRSDAALSPQPLHLSTQITEHASTEITSPRQEDDVFEAPLAVSGSSHCVACGCELIARRHPTDVQNGSPFLQRRKMTDHNIAEPSSGRSPFLAKKMNGFSVHVDSVSFLSNASHESGFGDASFGLVGSKMTSKPEDQSPKRSHAPNCTCGAKIRALDVKFAETRRLLRTNTIEGLDAEPPNFKPSPPPLDNKSKPPYSDFCLALNSVDAEGHTLGDLPNSMSHHKSNLICDKCSKSVVETIEDLPKLLPTDALNRPQLGLSYSMEDDLSPGVKEIQSSTPKSGASLRFSPKVVAKDFSSLSTFSQSVNSLGYVSSQSDLELNISTPESSNKIPITSLKSQTLPLGVKLPSSPFYSATDHSQENGFHSVSRDGKIPNHKSSSGDLGLRSSSAPPLPSELEKTKKKHMRGFSRKEKKDSKKRNEDNLSVKSDLSLDEGVILRKIEALDGSTEGTESVDNCDGAEDKPKKRSVWKSILRRK